MWVPPHVPSSTSANLLPVPANASQSTEHADEQQSSVTLDAGMDSSKEKGEKSCCQYHCTVNRTEKLFQDLLI